MVFGTASSTEVRWAGNGQSLKAGNWTLPSLREQTETNVLYKIWTWLWKDVQGTGTDKRAWGALLRPSHTHTPGVRGCTVPGSVTWHLAGRPCWCWAGRSVGAAEDSRPTEPRCPWAGCWRTASSGACSPAWRTEPPWMDLWRGKEERRKGAGDE